MKSKFSNKLATYCLHISIAALLNIIPKRLQAQVVTPVQLPDGNSFQSQQLPLPQDVQPPPPSPPAPPKPPQPLPRLEDLLPPSLPTPTPSEPIPLS